MAQTAAVLDIMVRANTASGISGLKKTNDSLQRTDRQTKKTEGRFLSLSRVGNKSFSVLATGAKAGGLAIGAGLAFGLKKATDEAREAAKVTRQTNAVLKSTGGVAKVSRKEVEDLATAISLKAGVDDEAVQSGQNLLLTFKNIRDEAGAGNTFERTAKAAVDMSAAMTAAGKSMSIADAMLQLGKAVNDPEKGMTRLLRTGVDFTQQQKDQVAALVASGQTVKAQAIILREVEAQFGGSAAANADGLNRLKVAFDNIMETLGAPLAAALSVAGNALATFIGQMQTGTGVGGRFAAALRTAFDTVKTAALGNAATARQLQAALVSAFHFIRAEITGFVQALNLSKGDFQNFGAAIRNVFIAVGAVVKAVWPGISRMIRGTLSTISGFVKIWSGILTLNFRQVWEGLKQIVSGSLQKVLGLIRASPLGAAATAAFNAIKKPASAAFGAVRSVVSSVFNGIKKLIGDVIAGILRRFAMLFDVAAKIPGIGGKFKTLADRARGAASEVDKVGESVKRVPSDKKVNVRVGVKWPKILKDTFPAFSGGGSGDGWPLSEAIGSLAQKGAQARINKLGPNDLAARLGGALSGSPFGPLGNQSGRLGKYKGISASMGLSAGRGPGQGFRPGDDGYHGVNRAFDSSGPAGQMMAFARHMAKHFGGNLLELIYTPMGFSIKNGRKVPPYAADDHYDHVHVAAQRGAMVPGSGSGDKVRALLEPGEGIINKKAVQAMGGRGAINALNSAIPRFASGGVVARAAHSAGFRGRTLQRMVAEAKGESGWDERAVGDGGKSKGLWQIHTGWNPWAARLNLFDPFVNARAAMRIFRSQGVGAWHAEHAPHMGAAARAIASMGRAKGKGKKAPKKVTARQRGLLVNFGGGNEVYGGNLGPGRHTSGFGTAKGFTAPSAKKGIPFTSQRVTRGEATEGAEAVEDPRIAAILADAEARKSQAEEAKALRASLDANTAEMRTMTALGLREAIRAFGDVISGELGGRASVRGQTAGDGYTMARL